MPLPIRRSQSDLVPLKVPFNATFPSSDHFPLAWQGKIGPFMMEKLDWSSQEAFVKSWMSALSDEEDIRFRRIMELLFSETSKPVSSQPTKNRCRAFYPAN